ncbi:MAG: murein L,D-transpeptidase [Verrucomicrobia bacterium]|nr:murein L,D-transpeptidase [Verrucomicrobiota bacterium]
MRTNAPAATNSIVIRPATNAPPPKATNTPTTSATNSVMSGRFAWPMLETQLALDRQGFSPGSIDGQFGLQTRAALRVTNYTVTPEDLARLQPVSPTWLGKSQQSALDYENILELVAEKSHAHPLLIKRLNPDVNWTNVTAGAVVQLTNIVPPTFRSKAAWVTIHLAGKTLEAFDSNTNLLAHFPCSIAARVEKRPVGELHVIVAAANPNYTFDPDVFPESAEAKQLKTKLILPPGPNNPVGVAWIGLDRPGYGIHGTPKPEDVGRTESHGCFRLANWNAELLLKLVSLGTPVMVVE